MHSDTCIARLGRRQWPTAVVALLALAACHGGEDSDKDVPGDPDDRRPSAIIGLGETIRVQGTEPFWNAEIRNSMLTYRTLERPAGEQGEARRFDGRGGISFSGSFADKDYTLAIQRKKCKEDGSDKIYPFTAFMQIGDEERKGCAWSDNHPAKPGKPDKTQPSGSATDSVPHSAAESGIIDS